MPEAAPSDTDRLLTQRDVAQKLGRSEGWVRRQTALGSFAYVDLGTPKRPAPRYRPEAIDAYLASLERPATAPANPYGRRRRGTAA